MQHCAPYLVRCADLPMLEMAAAPYLAAVPAEPTAVQQQMAWHEPEEVVAAGGHSSSMANAGGTGEMVRWSLTACLVPK